MPAKTLDFPTAIEAAGVSVEVLDGWDSINGHEWRTGDPEGHLWHHSATTGYTPNRNVANGWLGMGVPGGNRLYQDGGVGRVPIYVIGNAHPAPIGSGYGRLDVLEDYVRNDIAYVGKQSLPDDTNPQWAGNRSYWNTEIVLDGVGSEMTYGVWEAAVTIGAVINDVMGWTVARNIGHGQHTRRKIDLYDGRFNDMAETIDALRLAMGDDDMRYRDVDNVPEWGKPIVDWGIDNKIIITDDENQDDFTKNVDYGTLWALLRRMDMRFH